MHEQLTLISGRAHPALANEIADYLQVPLAKVDLYDFPDGEVGCKLNQNIRGRDVYLIQPTGPPVNDNLIELLVLIDTCQRASAERITAVLPYFGYARQDRKDSGRVPITSKLVANLITKAGADRVLTVDLHAAQIQGFFDVPVDHLYAAPIIDAYIETLNIPQGDLVIVSPDEGVSNECCSIRNDCTGHWPLWINADRARWKPSRRTSSADPSRGRSA